MSSRTPTCVLLAALLLASALACAAEPRETPAPALDSEEQKMLYALGVALAARLPNFDPTEDEMALIQAGLADGILGTEPRVDMRSVAPKIEPFLLQRVQVATEKEKAAGLTFLEAAAAETGVEKTASGMLYRELQAGDGASPGSGDQVKLQYVGKLRDGSTFDKSTEPVTFTVGGVVPCFGEGLQRMKVGGKSRFVCPSELAYGDRGSPPRIRPGATLVFEVELLEIVQAPAGESQP